MEFPDINKCKNTLQKKNEKLCDGSDEKKANSVDFARIHKEMSGINTKELIPTSRSYVDHIPRNNAVVTNLIDTSEKPEELNSNSVAGKNVEKPDAGEQGIVDIGIPNAEILNGLEKAVPVNEDTGKTSRPISVLTQRTSPMNKTDLIVADAVHIKSNEIKSKRSKINGIVVKKSRPIPIPGAITYFSTRRNFNSDTSDDESNADSEVHPLINNTQDSGLSNRTVLDLDRIIAQREYERFNKIWTKLTILFIFCLLLIPLIIIILIYVKK